KDWLANIGLPVPGFIRAEESLSSSDLLCRSRSVQGKAIRLLNLRNRAAGFDEQPRRRRAGLFTHECRIQKVECLRRHRRAISLASDERLRNWIKRLQRRRDHSS